MDLKVHTDLGKTKLLLLDFDGVLVESVLFKQNVFADVFSTLLEKNIATRAIDFSVKHDSLSRQKKFEFACSLQTSVNSNLISIEILNDRFNEIWEREKSKISEVEGASELLSYLSSHMQIHICSSAPKNEILFFLNKFSWECFIGKVYSTSNKTKTIRQILLNSALEPCEVIFVGDSLQDEISAQQNEIIFIPRIGSGTNYKSDLPSVQNMHDVLSTLMLKLAL
jgi:phosphoglycolate phosphatase-like HAD superfamily hydrolase